jgi:hypothetical protein
MIYVLVKNGGSTIAKEAFSGDTEMGLEMRKAFYPENTYEEVTKSDYDNEPDPEGGNYLSNSLTLEDQATRQANAEAKRNEILAGRG